MNWFQCVTHVEVHRKGRALEANIHLFGQFQAKRTNFGKAHLQWQDIVPGLTMCQTNDVLYKAFVNMDLCRAERNDEMSKLLNEYLQESV